MSEDTVALTVDDGCYHLTDPTTTQPLLYHTGTNGLVGVLGDGAACVCTGTLTGYVRLTVLTAQEPPAVDVDAWDEIVEVSVIVPSGRFRPAPPEGALLTNLASAGQGTYRLRVHARGRDAGHRADTVHNLDEISEEHLIVAWPDQDRKPETIIQTRDTFGAHLREHPSDPTTMPPPDPMTTGGVDMRADGIRTSRRNSSPTRHIHFD
jgi:hypothetical protein